MSGCMMKTAKAEHKSADFESRYMNSGSTAESEYAPASSRGPAIRESVSYGEEQGGLRDLFKGRFGKKKPEAPATFDGKTEDQLQISGPTLQKVSGHRVTDGDGGRFLTPENVVDLSKITDPAQREDEINYQAFMRSKTPPTQLAQNPKIRDRVMRDFTQEMQGALRKSMSPDSTVGKAQDQAERDAMAAAFRLNGNGMKGFGQLIRGNMPEHFMDALMDYGELGMRGVDQRHAAKVLEDTKGEKRSVEDYLHGTNGVAADPEVQKMVAVRDGAYKYIQSQFDRDGSPLAGIVADAEDAFDLGDGEMFGTEDLRSAILMNVVLNRVVTPEITRQAGGRLAPSNGELQDLEKVIEEAEPGSRQQKKAQKQYDRLSEQRAPDEKMFEYGRWLQSGVKIRDDASLQQKSNRGFMTSLKKHFRKR